VVEPRIEQRRIVGLHQLEAAIESAVVDDPAVEVAKTVRQQAALLRSSLVHAFRAVRVALDDHEQHRPIVPDPRAVGRDGFS
jgi:hypothetical protein